MDTLNLPDYSALLKIKAQAGLIFDPLRQKFVALTPEEWVRQNIVQHLSALGFPQGLMASEHPIEYNGLRKRCDIVVFNRQAQPCLIVECKAPSVAISQKVFDQIATYNLKLNVRHLIVTNGLHHFCCRMDAKGQVEFLPEFPQPADVL
ncbi:MAG: type I restriction enzyme HsdR N-terminal domain-containing protein [Salinivirgaceae bacterium]|nr:type I restriction enzyme HsdR N-terminal domain-containing protein [Salinivirgaceae bacterium]